MSGIVLSNAVRQNLSSLQATADLLATTQSRLSTGKKVNTALDNPTNFFTAASLDSRASDINNLLDGIGNGIQIIQSANTGITSLTKLVDSAKSIANQALQSVAGYTSKSSVSTTIAGATAEDLRGTSTYSNGVAQSLNLQVGDTGGNITDATLVGGVAASLSGVKAAVEGDGSTAINNATKLSGGTGAGYLASAGQPANGDTLTVNGRTITFKSGLVPSAGAAAAGSGVVGNVQTDGTGNSTVYLDQGNVGDLLKAIDIASGVAHVEIAGGTASVTLGSGTAGNAATGTLAITTSTGSDLSITGKSALTNALGLTDGASGIATVTQARGTSTGTVNSSELILAGSQLSVNGKTITFADGTPPNAAPYGSGKVGDSIVTDGNGNSTVYLQGKGNATPASMKDVLTAIDLATGVQTVSITNGVGSLNLSGTSDASKVSLGVLQISTGTASDLSITGTGNALKALGLAGPQGTATSFTATRTATAGGITGKTLSFESFNGGTAVNVTIGDGTNGTVKSLADLNAKLAANNMTASIDTTGKLTISASNDYASSTIGSVESGGKIGGTAAAMFSTPTDPVADVNAQTTRANLVTQYNNIIEQIKTTAQDASFNGVNLLGGDTLKLVFNETGKSTLSIQGVTFDPAGLGLSSLKSGKDFIDNASTNKVLSSLNTASTTLRSQASALGSNLSIVQTRQDFSKNLINVLQTGSSNLTLADTNEEAANSQALSTRQSIAVSALSLANSSQQSVLQLLR